ncbi:MAG: hypothetical protein P8Q48_07900 [Paracoccaceae bacterium]|nr:hypothetical protein [Paracoccaceae bacterium]
MPLNRRVFLATAMAAALPSTLWAKSKDPIRLALGQNTDSQVM